MEPVFRTNKDSEVYVEHLTKPFEMGDSQRIEEIVVVRSHSTMRSTFELWTWNDGWDVDKDTGILEILMPGDNDDICEQCESMLNWNGIDVIDPTENHDDGYGEIHSAEDTEFWFCCDTIRDQHEAAASQTKRGSGRYPEEPVPLYGSYVYLDGGDVVCRWHFELETPVLWLDPRDIGKPYANQDAFISQWLERYATNDDDMRRYVIKTIPLEASLLRASQEAERARIRYESQRGQRDRLLHSLRAPRTDDGHTLEYLATLAGLTPQRAGQIVDTLEADHRRAHDDFRQRVLAETGQDIDA